MSSESKVGKFATQREGRKANLRDNLLKRKSELQMAMVELGGDEQIRRSSVRRVAGSLGDDDDAMELVQELGLEEESDPLRVDLQLLEHNVKEIEEELVSLETNLSTRKDEVIFPLCFPMTFSSLCFPAGDKFGARS